MAGSWIFVMILDGKWLTIRYKRWYIANYAINCVNMRNMCKAAICHNYDAPLKVNVMITTCINVMSPCRRGNVFARRVKDKNNRSQTALAPVYLFIIDATQAIPTPASTVSTSAECRQTTVNTTSLPLPNKVHDRCGGGSRVDTPQHFVIAP